MPVPWVAIPAAIFLTPAQGVPASSQGGVRQVYGDLVVEARSATFTEELATFREGVRATFAGEVLTADSLVLRPKEQSGEATGHVVLLDPAGTITAENLTFSWKPGAKGGSGNNVHLELAGVMMNAEKAESIPGDPPTLIFTNVYGTSCGRERTPLYAIRSPRVVFRPGKDGVIRRPVLYLFGKRIATLPDHRFSLDPRIRGVPMPGIALSGNQIGVRWAPSFLIDKNTTANINIRSFEGEHIRASAYVTRSYLQEQDINNLIEPRSDLTERFNNSYFNNIRIKSPESAAKSLSAKRENLSVGTEWNRSSRNDLSSASYSKLIEGVYERGGPLGSKLGYQFSVRAQDIRRNDEPFHARVVAQGSIGPKPQQLAKNLFVTSRLDAATYLGSNTSGWSRAEVGMYVQPAPWVRLGVAYAHGQEFGDPMFPADRLLIREMGSARLDLNFGPTKLSILEKRDFDRDRWYQEYAFSQIMGCLEFSIISRDFPNSYHLGLTLRLDEFLDLLKARRSQFGAARNASTTPPTEMNHAVRP